MKPLDWRTEHEFVLEGVRFLCSLDDYNRKTDPDRVIILKDRKSLESYFQVLTGLQVRNVLEFGILQGGSAVLFSLLLGLNKFVGLDICDPPKGLAEFLSQKEVGKRMKLHFNSSQSDARRVREIVKTEFAGAPIDLIIDDASHQYDLSKTTFEVAFPLLRPGGIYVIEDWGWPHWKGCTAFRGQPALSKLIFELTMACATSSNLISDIRIFPSFAFIRKSESAPALQEISLDNLYEKRGIFLTFEDFEAALASKTRELEAIHAARAPGILRAFSGWIKR